jgi:hypothetical protein
MPSKSKKQAKFMAAVANNPKFAKKAGVPQSVGQEFANADKRNKDMPSYFNSSKKKPGTAVKKGYAHGGAAHAKRVMRNLDDEDYRIRNRTGSNTDAERRRINREKEYEATRMAKGGKVKKQGYNARQDESLGSRNKTKGQQNLKSRRDEAQAMEKKGGKRKYSDVSTMDKGSKKFAKGGKTQGYNARQDESLGSRNKTKGQQNLKSRRDEAQAMEKKGGKRKYSDVSTMDKGRKKKFNMGGKVSCDGVAQRGLTKIARKRG